jgi:hypothetical protein
MAVLTVVSEIKSQVFLSSRFEEFGDLRGLLKLRLHGLTRPRVDVIDLNDNAPDTRPPIERSYDAVDRADVFILLVGNSYSDGKSNGLSYTHLEYRRVRRNRSTIVLPFVINGLATDPKNRSCCDRRIVGLIDEVQRHHCASYHDPQTDPQRLASDIFEAILMRLWEQFENDTGLPEDAYRLDPDVTQFVEDSPIRRSQLKTAPRRGADEASDGKVIRRQAGSHCIEAHNALAFGLPSIAIHHLRHAVDLVPLDVVSSYWLARLLIATGRRKECQEGRTLALRATQVAAKEEDEAQALRTMAALILASRASERLHEPKVALVHARNAYAAMPYHWLANIELGRQHAASGAAEAALDLATKAFWLRPDCLHRIRHDDRFRALDGVLDRFQRGLHKEVVEQADRVFAVERAAVDLVVSLSAASPPLVSRPVSTTSDGKGDLRTILTLVEATRESARASLTALHQCGVALLRTHDAFEWQGHAGLNEVTGEAIRTARDRGAAHVRELDASCAASLAEAQMTATRRQAVELTAAVIVLGIVAVIWMMNTFRAGPGTYFWFGVIFVGLGLVLSAAWKHASNASRVANATLLDVRQKLESAAAAHASAAQAWTQYSAERATLRSWIDYFCTLVNAFEREAGKRLSLSPAVAMHRQDAAADAIFRVPSNPNSTDQAALESAPSLLPPALASLLPAPSLPLADQWFGRRIPTREGRKVLSRAAAYFPSV